MLFDCFSCFQNEKHVFEAFCVFTKWINLFRSVLHLFKMKKTRFRSVFHVCKRKIMFLKSFWSVQNKKYAFEAFCIFTKWKNKILKRFSCLQAKKHVFEEFFICKKWNIRFGLSLQDKNARFQSVFHVCKWKNAFSKHFESLQNEKHVFETFFVLTKWKHVFEEIFMCTKWKSCFWRVFHLNKMKDTFSKHFASFRSILYLYKVQKHAFEACFKCMK